MTRRHGNVSTTRDLPSGPARAIGPDGGWTTHLPRAPSERAQEIMLEFAGYEVWSPPMVNRVNLTTPDGGTSTWTVRELPGLRWAVMAAELISSVTIASLCSISDREYACRAG